MLKRLLDVLGSIVGLIILAPLLILISLAIKRDSKGPVFFRQIRVGKNGALFSIFKFRTMVDAQTSTTPQVTVQGDRRITKVGGFLRCYKIDELPQLINVFKGEMSLVGPRPEVPLYMNLYSKQQRTIILSVKPGLTDYAALELRNEEALLAGYPDPHKAYVEILMPRKFELYQKYIGESNLLIDVKLIYKTIKAIFRQPSGSINE